MKTIFSLEKQCKGKWKTYARHYSHAVSFGELQRTAERSCDVLRLLVPLPLQTVVAFTDVVMKLTDKALDIRCHANNIIFAFCTYVSTNAVQHCKDTDTKEKEAKEKTSIIYMQRMSPTPNQPEFSFHLERAELFHVSNAPHTLM